MLRVINDLTSPVERESIIDVSQQGVDSSCTLPLALSGSSDCAGDRSFAFTDRRIPDFVVAFEGDGG